MTLICWGRLRVVTGLLTGLTIAVTLTACDELTSQGGATLHKAGETVGRSATVLVDGIGEGIKRGDKRQLVVSEALQKRGLRTGKFFVSKAEVEDDGKKPDGDNRLTVYCIFDKALARPVTATLVDEAGQEYGRKRVQLTGKAGDARNVDFVFDPRTDIERGTRITLE